MPGRIYLKFLIGEPAGLSPIHELFVRSECGTEKVSRFGKLHVDYRDKFISLTSEFTSSRPHEVEAIEIDTIEDFCDQHMGYSGLVHAEVELRALSLNRTAGLSGDKFASFVADVASHDVDLGRVLKSSQFADLIRLISQVPVYSEDFHIDLFEMLGSSSSEDIAAIGELSALGDDWGAW